VHQRPQTLRRNLLACDAVFANSRYTQGIVERVQHFDNTVVVAPGIPFDAYRDDRAPDYRLQHGWQGRQIVLMLSRLVRRKGHATVIHAVAALRHKHPQLLLVIAGKGGYREDIERLIDEAGIGDHAELIGLVPEADKPALYRACEVFCMPSDESEATFDTEGFGITFLEAAAVGCIAIGSRAGGMADAVEEGASGFLVEPGNVEQLAEILDRVLSAPEQFNAMREYARARAASFDWSNQADKMFAELARRVPAPAQR
jgi:phosphatidylinositol alpha-1,6-mannosyltransferase